MSKEKAKDFAVSYLKAKLNNDISLSDVEHFDRMVFVSGEKTVFITEIMEAYADQKVLDFVAEKIEKGEAYVSELSFGENKTEVVSNYVTFEYKKD